jgi:hypothetical protein
MSQFCLLCFAACKFDFESRARKIVVLFLHHYLVDVLGQGKVLKTSSHDHVSCKL